MKMAKANEADLNMAMELCNALDALTNKWSPTMPEGAATDCDDEEVEHFNIDNNDQCRRALEYLIALADRASLMRVVWGCAVMLDPANALVDPKADTIELHPGLRDAKEQRDKLLAAIRNHKQVKGRFHTEQATIELYRVMEEIEAAA